MTFDYRTKILNYVAANSEQERVVLGQRLLRLPKVYGEDEEPEEEEEEGAPPPTTNQGVTFDLVDQGLNALDVPNVLMREGAWMRCQSLMLCKSPAPDLLPTCAAPTPST